MPDKAEKIINTRPENQIKYSDGLYFIKATDEFHKGLGEDIHDISVYVVRKINFTFNPNVINGFGFDGETLIFQNLKNAEDKLLVNIHYSKFKPLWFQSDDTFLLKNDNINEEVIIRKLHFSYTNKIYLIDYASVDGNFCSTNINDFFRLYELI